MEGITIQAGQEDSSELVAATTVPPKEAALSSLQRMESIATGKQKARTEMEELQQLQELNQATTLNDSRVNGPDVNATSISTTTALRNPVTMWPHRGRIASNHV